jgi:hypothetical protein
MKIELLYFDGCPSYQTADRLLREALAEENHSATIEMIKIETEADAQRWKFVGSPTIRLDGVDPFPRDETNYGLECRVYVTPDGYRGWPTKAMLRDALNSNL